jgi:integrase/recombinase XerD
MSTSAEPLSVREAIAQYQAWLMTTGRSAATVLTRMAHLRQFERWTSREGWSLLSDVTLHVLDQYRGAVASAPRAGQQSLALSTRHGRLAAVRLLLRWAVRSGRLADDPSVEWELPRMPRRLPRAVLSAGEVERLFTDLDVESPMGLRDRALLEVLFSTGMRRGEIVRLRLQDVDASRGLVFIREGKGGKDRVVPIGARALGWYARYLTRARPCLAARRKSGIDDGTAFLAARGYAIRPTRLTDRLHALVQKGTGKPGACHIFRHSMATLMHDGGADIRDLQELLGHAQISTTEIYTHVSVERLRAVHALTHPSEAGRAWLGHQTGGGVGAQLLTASASAIRSKRVAPRREGWRRAARGVS